MPLLLSSMFACPDRPEFKAPAADDTAADADTVAEPATVRDVQGGLTGTVTLTGVIATTTDISSEGLYFWVQDPGGGPRSGVLVFAESSPASATIGDELTIVGAMREHYGLTQIVVTDPADLVITGSGSPVEERLSSEPADWETYEGVLVELAGVMLTSDPDGYGQVTTSWGIVLDDLLWDHGTLDMAEGDEFGSITGVVSYSYETYRLMPRDAGDVVY